MVENQLEKKENRFRESITPPLIYIAIIWAIHIFQHFTTYDFGRLGLYPRDLSGLKGIFFSPLIHGDFLHLISNTAPFLVLATIIFYFYRSVATRSLIMIYFLSGLAVWIFGRSVFHIGASGVVYGMVAFVFWNGVFRKSMQSIVLSLIVVLLYSGMFLGLDPYKEGVSWESHLLGALIGIFTSFFYKEALEIEELEKEPLTNTEAEPVEYPYFLPRDVFEKTKVQRFQEALEQKAREKAERERRDWESNNTWDA